MIFFIILFFLSCLPDNNSVQTGNNEASVPVKNILSGDQIDYIHEDIKSRRDWRKNDYELVQQPEWNNTIVPLIIAIPRILDASSPRYALMPDGTFLTFRDDSAFERILSAYYPEITLENYIDIIELFLWFGKAEFYIGELWTNSLEGRIEDTDITDSGPFFERNENDVIIMFYTYDYELLDFYYTRLSISLENYPSYALEHQSYD